KDRRRFSPDGESDPGDDHKKPEQTEKEAEPSKREARTKEPKEKRPPMNFSALIASLAQTCLFQLGLLRTPDMTEPMKADLEGARQTIDLIAILEEKTKGNLTEEEKKLVDETLFQLRMTFVEVSK
ncbi:MAG: DUF1844 domain-containing protein, partial [Pseudomonadota bacterium]